MVEDCSICGRRMLNSNPLDLNCGGDCRSCMAECGDDDAFPTAEEQATLDKYHRYGVFAGDWLYSVWTTRKGAFAEAKFNADARAEAMGAPSEFRYRMSYDGEQYYAVQDVWLDNVDHCPSCNSSFGYKMGDADCGLCRDTDLIERLRDL